MVGIRPMPLPMSKRPWKPRQSGPSAPPAGALEGKAGDRCTDGSGSIGLLASSELALELPVHRREPLGECHITSRAPCSGRGSGRHRFHKGSSTAQSRFRSNIGQQAGEEKPHAHRAQAFAASRLGERGAQIRLPDTGLSDDDHVVLLADPLARREIAYDGLVEAAARLAPDILEGSIVDGELGGAQEPRQAAVVAVAHSRSTMWAIFSVNDS
jgi:hypothetical protein